jgi:dipicolinate synthase subunit A
MLTGRHLVFVGGDARMLEVIAQTADNDASATLIGFELSQRSFPDTEHGELSDEVLGRADALVLPISGMDEDGRVDSKFSDDPIILEDSHFAQLRPGTHVFTGIARSLLKARCVEYGLVLVSLMELDEVAILNSIPTAEGAVSIAMEKTDITLHGSQTVVIGFGRCGQTLARTLAALGAKVRVVARQSCHLARIREMGLQPAPMADLEFAVGDADVVFNTIPALVLTAGVLKTMRRECVIIDIASKPGGTDFRYAERRGMTALLAPSLPGLVAPKTAGRIIAASLSRILAEAHEIPTQKE